MEMSFRSDWCMDGFCFRIIAVGAVDNIVGFSGYTLSFASYC